MVDPDRTAHDAYERRHREVDADTRERFAQVADALGLEPPVRSSFLATCLKAAQLHAAESALVDHELRSGRSWPAEDRLAREHQMSSHWESSLNGLRTAAARSDPVEGAADEPEEPQRRYQVRYQPISSISRRPSDA